MLNCPYYKNCSLVETVSRRTMGSRNESGRNIDLDTSLVVYREDGIYGCLIADKTSNCDGCVYIDSLNSEITIIKMLKELKKSSS